MMDITDKEIEAAVDYIWGDTDKKPKRKLNLKVTTMEGNNGTYKISEEGIRLQAEQAYIDFEKEEELDKWVSEFKEAFVIKNRCYERI